MKQIVTYLFILSGLFYAKKSDAQNTVLMPGDMAFIGFDGGNNDFTFVTLVNLASGTTFYYSDCAYGSTLDGGSPGFCQSQSQNKLEHCLVFTVGACTIESGTIFHYDDSKNYPTVGALTFSNGGNAFVAANACGCGVTVAFNDVADAGSNGGISSSGDNGFLFQGSYQNPTFICGIMIANAWEAAGSVTCANAKAKDTELPPAIASANVNITTTKSNYYYKCTVVGSGSSITEADWTAINAAIFNPSNFTNDNTSTVPQCDFNIGDATCLTVLPITLTTFSAKPTSSSVQLNWTTASETNNNYFTVEKSTDGVLFKEIIQVKGAGNSEVTKHYTALDENPFDGINYYRLKQTDFNGHFKYANILEVDYGLQSNPKVYPNPTNGTFIIETKNNAQCILYNANGSEVLNQTINGKTTIDGSNLNEGVYNLSIISNENVVNKRLVVVR